MSKKPIQPSLFRFVTLRSPQAIEDKENQPGLITASTVKDHSEYYNAVASLDKDDADYESAKKTALEDVTLSEENLITKKSDLKSLSENLYTFSSWLMRNKNYLSYASVESNLSSYLDDSDPNFTLTTGAPTSQISKEEIKVWDNLLRLTLEKASPSLREALIQMLIANQFAKDFKEYYQNPPEHNQLANLGEGEVASFNDEDEKEFRKRANASVIIDKEVLSVATISESTTTTGISSLPKSTEDFLHNDLATRSSQERIDLYTKALEELEREETLYNSQNSIKYNTDLEVYNTTTLNDHLNNPYDAPYAEDNQTDPYPEKQLHSNTSVPPFVFSPIELDFQTNTGKVFDVSGTNLIHHLSSETLALFKRDDLKPYSEFITMKAAIKDCLQKEENYISGFSLPLSKSVNIAGTTITVDPSITSEYSKYCFVGSLEHQKATNGDDEFSITLNIITGTDIPQIAGDEVILSHNLVEPSIGATGSLVENRNGKMVYKVSIPNNSLTEYGVWTLEGAFSFLDNGELKSVILSAPINYYSTKLDPCRPNYYLFKGCSNNNEQTTVTTTSSNIPSFEGIINLGIADFRRVEQEVCCYVPGEVSHIENILAKEYKEKATRSLVSSEVTNEQTNESEVENLTDTTSTERNELQSEASSVIDQDNSRNFGASASITGGGKRGMPAYNINSYGDFSSSNATSNSNSQAQNYAQEVTERALERVVQKVSSKRTSRVLREFEENTKHGFDNSKGEKNITGVYRWVDKVYKNRLVNYGKRLMYEFAIPEPAKFLKDVFYNQGEIINKENGFILPKDPVHPSSLGINSAKDLKKTTYQSIVAKYNIDTDPYPEESINVSGSSGGYPASPNEEQSIQLTFNVDIPENYRAHSATFDLNYTCAFPFESHGHAVVTAGGKELKISNNPKATMTKKVTFTDKIERELAVSLIGSDVGAVSCNVTAICELTTAGKEAWQNTVYAAIMEAYDTQVETYNNFISSNQDIANGEEAQSIQFNPLFNRSLEKQELKRLAIELLTKSTDIQVSRDNYIINNNTPEIVANTSFGEHAAVVKFFEQAFDWEIMAYNFYPYFYTDSQKWRELLEIQDGSDPIFQAFLQSGMARIVVPVSPRFEDAVNWYQTTGEIWNGQGMVTDMNDELYVSIAEEMLEPESITEGTWETRVPTSLTILQARSASLDEGGLPCNTDCFDEPNNINESTFVISGGGNSNSTSGIGSDTVGEDNTVT